MKEEINQLYKVFSTYTILGNIRDRSCDCCVSNEEIEELLSKPLKELTGEELSYFMSSAVTTFGDVNDYKHFLPRILELILVPDVLDDFLVYEKLDYSQWKSWNESEVTSIKSYFKELLINYLNQSISVFILQDIISVCARYLGLKQVLEIWINNLSDNHLNFFVEYKLDGIDLLFVDIDVAIFDEWLTNTFVLDELERFYLRTENTIEANRISIVYTMLENERNYLN